MGWHMKLVICVQLAYVSVCLTQLSVVREWTSLEVHDSWESRRRTIMPAVIDCWFLYKDRLYVSLGAGEEYSLTYLDLTDNSTSLLLQPAFPSQEGIYYIPVRVCVDRCDRLWLLSVMAELTGIIVLDLKTNSILINTFFPFIGIANDMTVDDFDCDNEYVYITSDDKVWTYSLAERGLWGHKISDRITSMILAPNSIVYYNLGSEPMVYYMSTTHLRDKSNTNKTYDMRELGRSRKLNVNLASSALDAKSDVLYYFDNDNRTVIHTVPCWTSERCSSNCQDVSIDPTHELRYITLDENGDLWAVTSRSNYADGEINLRLLSLPGKRTCVESNANDTTDTSTDVEPNAEDTTDTTNIKYEITTPASSTPEQTSTLGSVHKTTTVNIADTTAGTPNSNINLSRKPSATTNMPYLLFSFTNTTFNFNLSFTNNYFH